jgi:DNA-directed RNA polymerase subunit RPC12/RpoP
MDFACEHCGTKALRMVAVAEETVRFECLSCSKETTFERRPEPVLVANFASVSVPRWKMH